MNYSDLIEHFGSQGEIAQALGITAPSVCDWQNKGIPPLRQLQIETLTRGKLKADSDVYEKPSKRAKVA